MDRAALRRHAKRWALAVVIAGFVVLGVRGLWTAVGLPLALAALAVAVLAASARFNEIAGRIVGGIVVGALVLFGVNVVVDNAVDLVHAPRPWIPLGLAFAVAVFSVAAGWYLRGSPPSSTKTARASSDPPPATLARRLDAALGRGRRWGFWTTAVTATALGVLLIVDAPIIVERGARSARSMAVGLVLAVVFVGVGAWCRLKKQDASRPRRFGVFAAPIAGLALLASAPIALQQAQDRVAVPARFQVPSRVDVRIVTDGSSHPLPPRGVKPDPALAGFDVVYSVGVPDGDAVRWTLLESRDRAEALRIAALGRRASDAPGPVHRPLTRDGADPVLVLLVDGTSPVLDRPPDQLPIVRRTTGEIGRWHRIARSARERGMPTYALLQTTRRSRLDAWRRSFTAGPAISVQATGRRAVADVALALAIGAPSADDDLALAVAHRPILLFDTSEPVPLPLSVDWLFSDRRVTLCRDQGATRTDCDAHPTTDPARLENNATHLEIRRPDPKALKDLARREATEAEATLAAERSQTGAVPGAPPDAVPDPAPAVAQGGAHTPQTAIYVHAVPVEQGRRSLLYLDYWWYLPENPVTVGLRAFCGAGLVIPGITCHDHQSDWEGMTVVVDRTTTPRVISVHYAEHEEVVAFDWGQLRRRWDGDAALARIVAGADGGAGRPLAFVASGTHSTYPIPCRITDCRQFATARGEDSYRGGLPWIGNFTNQCGTSSCVHRLPTSVGGSQPALWNAFTGTWGSKSCALAYYCDSAEPPPAPGRQRRYRNPSACTGVADGNWAFRRKPCDG